MYCFDNERAIDKHHASWSCPLEQWVVCSGRQLRYTQFGMDHEVGREIALTFEEEETAERWHCISLATCLCR